MAAQFTGGGPRTSGFYYDVSYNRALSPPKMTTPYGIPGGPSLCPGDRWNPTGIIIRGLLAQWRVSQEDELLDTCIAAGRAMLENFCARDIIHPVLALPHKRPLAHQPHWSTGPGCYQLKAALAWYELYDATGETHFLRAYESAVERSLASEKDFLPGEAYPNGVMDRLHAYTYFLEGLLPGLHQRDSARVFRDGINRTAA